MELAPRVSQTYLGLRPTTTPWRVFSGPDRLAFGGDERIRTTESKANGFTVRPIWPTLEHPQTYCKLIKLSYYN